MSAEDERGEGTPAGVAKSETVAGAGWHPDPFDLADERWWDGARWTRHVREAQAGEDYEDPAQFDETPSETARGRPPGWYPWRGEVSRWWDGEEWGPSRRPFAERPEQRPAAKFHWSSPRAGYGYAALLVVVVIGVVVWLSLGGGSNSTRSYQATVGKLCTRTFALERSEIQRESTAAVAGRKPRSQAIFVGELLRALARDNAAFDARLEAIAPPSALRAAQHRYLALEQQDSAIYSLVIPRVEGRRGLPALTTVTGLLSKNAQKLQRLLIALGGQHCSISPLGLG